MRSDDHLERVMYVLGTVIRAVGRERILEEFLGLAYLFKILRIVCSDQVYANRNNIIAVRVSCAYSSPDLMVWSGMAKTCSSGSAVVAPRLQFSKKKKKWPDCKFGKLRR